MGDPYEINWFKSIKETDQIKFTKPRFRLIKETYKMRVPDQTKIQIDWRDISNASLKNQKFLTVALP